PWHAPPELDDPPRDFADRRGRLALPSQLARMVRRQLGSRSGHTRASPLHHRASAATQTPPGPTPPANCATAWPPRHYVVASNPPARSTGTEIATETRKE